MKYAVWGRTKTGNQQWLMEIFWTKEEADQYKANAEAGKVLVHPWTGEHPCAEAKVEPYDGSSQVGEGRPIKQPAKQPAKSPKKKHVTTVMGPGGLKKIVLNKPAS